jgi:glycosyltransferase involved in cell wall biosynthesis
MRKAWIDPRGWLRYIRWRRSTRPEILHAHLPHASFFARFSRLLAPTPVLIDTIHTTAAGSLSRRLVYHLTHFLTNRLTCVSRAVQHSVRSAHIAPNSTVIPNGIRIPELPNQVAIHLPDTPFRWLAVGRLAPVKDYPTLLRAFRQLPAPTTLSIAGAGPEEAHLRTLAADLGIGHRVEFLGFQPQIQPLLAEAHAFVQSSLWEGLPISILEASASALPIVATDAAGVRETLIPGQTGVLVPINNPEALAAAMLHLMKMDPEHRREIGLNGRAFVQTNFSLSAITDQWEELYTQLLYKIEPLSQTSPESTPTPAKASKVSP